MLGFQLPTHTGFTLADGLTPTDFSVKVTRYSQVNFWDLFGFRNLLISDGLFFTILPI